MGLWRGIGNARDAKIIAILPAASGQRTVPHVALQVVVLDIADGELHGTSELVGGDSKSGELQKLEVGGKRSRQPRV